jgi:oligopeptide transport system ATP-binding protein
MAEQEVNLHVEDLKMHFPIKRGVIQRTVGYVHAVDGVTFDIYKGETLGLVGEIGLWKNHYRENNRTAYKASEGKVLFEGKDLVRLKGEELRLMRRKIQMIFQDPYASLNPRMTVEQIIGNHCWFIVLHMGKKFGNASRICWNWSG